MPPNAPDSHSFIYSTDVHSPPKRRYQTSPGRSGRSNAPTAFFLRSEQEINRMSNSRSPLRHQAIEDSTYGVRSLNSSASASCVLSDETSEELGHSQSTGEAAAEASLMYPTPRSDSPFMPDLGRRSAQEHGSTGSTPIPPVTRLTGLLTPLLLRSPQRGSSADSEVPSTPKSVSLRSLRLSDDDYSVDEATSQVLTSSGEDEDEEEMQEENLLPNDAVTSGSAPQLVMPSIRIPSRRPFTERGKGIGKLKIMVAGAKGSGKTSLIRAMVHICHDIVHVDTLPSSSLSMTRTNTRTSASSRHTDLLRDDTTEITEIPVSTRAYPTWWAEVDDSSTLRRRRSLNETILERNLCFIDTPGLEGSDHTLQGIVQHVEGLLYRCHSFESFSDGELLNILSGNGGVQIDVVLYMLKDTPSDAELDMLKRLADLTNVIPLIAHADNLSSEAIPLFKEHILSSLASAHVRPFLFGKSTTELFPSSMQSDLAPTPPYAVSTSPSSDLESMETSLLMTPDYNPDLAPGDLAYLTQHLFDPDTTAWLRHLSARKFLQWRREQFGRPTITAASTADTNGLNILNGFPLPTFPATVPAPTSSLATSSLPVYTSSTTYPTIPTTSPFTAARLADHTLHEERLTQLRLSRWAADLQRSLRDERERYAALQRDERRRWLMERVKECDEADADARGVSTFNSANSSDGEERMELQGERRTRKSRGFMMSTEGFGSARDPLGLLGWEEKMRGSAGLVVVQVAGACGVLGALAVWAVRSWVAWKGSAGLSTSNGGHEGWSRGLFWN